MYGKLLPWLMMIFVAGCTKRIPLKDHHIYNGVMQPVREINLVVVPKKGREPAHLLYTKTETYRFGSIHNNSFKEEISINPLMHEVTLKAQIFHNGKVVREHHAKKSIERMLSDTQNIWTSSRAKLLLHIPNIHQDESLVVTTSYTWMDPRWHWPLFLEAKEPTGTSTINVDVPFGIDMHFRASKDKETYSIEASSKNIENLLWSDKNKQGGIGSRYTFFHDFGLEPSIKNPSDRLQLFFSFDLPMQYDKSSLFNSWENVSNFLYKRIDRYDLPSNMIRDFTRKECDNEESDIAKVTCVIAFLKKNIEKRNTKASFLEQEVQPATRTFAKRFGTAFDAAILGKAMFKSLDIEADIVAIASSEQNPKINDFFTPVIFNRVILSINADNQTFYIDLASDNNRIDIIDPSLQGQNALIIRKDSGQFFTLPYTGAEYNVSNLFYNLNVDEDGKLSGDFTLDTYGINADKIRTSLAKLGRSLSAPELQKHLNLNDSLGWRTASLEDLEDINNIAIKGELSPRLLKKDNNGLSLKILDILNPALSHILDVSENNFSYTTRVLATIAVPQSYMTPFEPLSNFIEGSGISGRLQVNYEGQQLYFEGEAIISMPVNKKGLINLESEQMKIKQSLEMEIPLKLADKASS